MYVLPKLLPPAPQILPLRYSAPSGGLGNGIGARPRGGFTAAKLALSFGFERKYFTGYYSPELKILYL